jgi:hypothetical protein
VSVKRSSPASASCVVMEMNVKNWKYERASRSRATSSPPVPLVTIDGRVGVELCSGQC